MKREIVYTLLVDNQVSADLLAEHGFAALIEVAGKRILFDTGAGKALLPNAIKLGVEISQLDALVLSHGHYDHTGGVSDVLALNAQVDLYIGQAAALPRFSCHADKGARAIGMRDKDYQALLHHPMAQVHELHAPLRLPSGLNITGPIPRLSDFEDTGGPFFLDAEQQQEDRLEDDQAIWVETAQGLVIAVGCCHAGLINTVEYIRKISCLHKVSGIVGGLHLLHASQTRIEKTLNALQNWQLDFLIPCHCTGDSAMAQLETALGEGVVKFGQAGMRLSLGNMQ